MRIAPIDIAHKTFGRKMMGLDGDEVIEFLRDVADQMEEIIRERNSLKESVREKDLAIIEYRERDQTLKSTIETATKMSEGIRQEAEREARLVMQDAHQKAELIVADARDSLKRIYQEISELKRSRMQFDASLRSLLHAHLAMLDQSHSMVLDPTVTVGRPPAPTASGTNMSSAATHSQNVGSSPASYAPPQQGVRQQAAVQAPVSSKSQHQAPVSHEASANSYAPSNQTGYSMSLPSTPGMPPAGSRVSNSGAATSSSQAPTGGQATQGNASTSMARMPRPTQTLPK